MSKLIDPKGTYLACYVSLLAALAFSSGHFSNPDASLRLVQSFSLANGDGFAVPEGVGDPSHGNIAVGAGGNRYSVYAPGQIVLFSPIAKIASDFLYIEGLHPYYVAEVLASFLGPFIHFMTAFLVCAVSRFFGRGENESLLLGVIYGIGVMSLASSRDGYEHTYEAFFLLASAYAAWLGSGSRKSSQYFVLAGFVLGVGSLFRPNILVAIPALFFIARSFRSVFLIVLGLMPCLVLLLLYNDARFGNPFETGYPDAWRTANPDVVSSFDLSWSHLKVAVPGLLFSPGKGLFVFSPILLVLLLFGTSSVVKSAGRSMPILYVFVAYLCLYAPNFAWHGSVWSWGPRYLVPVIPFLVLAIPLEGLTARQRLVFCWLGCVSATIQFLAIATNYKRHLIDIWDEAPSLFDTGQIIFRVEFSPILGSVTSFGNAVGNLFSDEVLFTFFPSQGWVNEARPATLKMMLDSSTDLNSIDIWWLRIVYFPINDVLKISIFVFGLSTTVLAILCLKKVVGGRSL